MRPTLELIDLFDQVRELMRVSLVRAEISERAGGDSIQPHGGRC